MIERGRPERDNPPEGLDDSALSRLGINTDVVETAEQFVEPISHPITAASPDLTIEGNLSVMGDVSVNGLTSFLGNVISVNPVDASNVQLYDGRNIQDQVMMNDSEIMRLNGDVTVLETTNATLQNNVEILQGELIDVRKEIQELTRRFEDG